MNDLLQVWLSYPSLLYRTDSVMSGKVLGVTQHLSDLCKLILFSNAEQKYYELPSYKAVHIVLLKGENRQKSTKMQPSTVIFVL